jgi:hypothetical protein
MVQECLTHEGEGTTVLSNFWNYLPNNTCILISRTVKWIFTNLDAGGFLLKFVKYTAVLVKSGSNNGHHKKIDRHFCMHN